MFYCTVFSYYCSKTSFICFSGFHRKKHNDIGKYIWSHVLQVSQVKHTLARQSSFSVFRKLFFHTVFSLRPEYLRSMSNAATLLLEPCKNSYAKVRVLCCSGFCFTIENESVCFNCFPVFNHSKECRRGEFLRDVSSLPLYRRWVLLPPSHDFERYKIASLPQLPKWVA